MVDRNLSTISVGHCVKDQGRLYLEITQLDIAPLGDGAPDEGDDLTYSVTVRNFGGDAITGSFNVRVTLTFLEFEGEDQFCGEPIDGSSSITHLVEGGLAAFGELGDSKDFNLVDFDGFDYLGSPRLSTGSYCLRAEADADLDIDETDEDNNVNEFDFFVSSGGVVS